MRPQGCVCDHGTGRTDYDATDSMAAPAPRMEDGDASLSRCRSTGWGIMGRHEGCDALSSAVSAVPVLPRTSPATTLQVLCWLVMEGEEGRSGIGRVIVS